MGFFSDLKEDLSQAVNELLPDTEETNDVKDTVIPERVETSETVEELNLSDMLDKLDQLGADMNFASMNEQKEEESVAEEPTELFSAEMLAAASTTPAEEEGKVEEEEIPPTMEVSGVEIAVELGNVIPTETIPEMPETEVEAVLETEDELSELDKMLQEAELTSSVSIPEEKIIAKEEVKMEVKRVASDETAIITAGMTIRGDVETEGNLDLIGKVIGNIDIMGKLNITGSVEGNSSATEIYAEKAHIIGEVKSEGAVKIGQSSVIVGNVFGNSAVVAGAVKGDIDVKGPVILDSTAIVMGNIKSKSVQINNGAVIEGMCSQCYADVSPSTFFADLKFI